jgi:hypothetical protein
MATRTQKISLKVEPHVHNALGLCARDLKMTNSAYIRATIIKSLERSGYLTREQVHAVIDGELERVG